jgi:hypothetical protein
MKERPILFSDDMVRAILAGTKTQTRRLVKPQPQPRGSYVTNTPGAGDPGSITWCEVDDMERLGHRDPRALWHQQTCPYGAPGDRLWAREAHAFVGCGPEHTGALEWGMHNIYGGDHEGDPGSERFRVHYRASGDEKPEAGDRPGWRPSIFMPRWASRITLEVTDVRVQRLQDISEEDARAEGITEVAFYPDEGFPLSYGFMVGADDGHAKLDVSPIETYRKLWERINGAGSWEQNPWVWCISFKHVDVVRESSGRPVVDGGQAP